MLAWKVPVYVCVANGPSDSGRMKLDECGARRSRDYDDQQTCIKSISNKVQKEFACPCESPLRSNEGVVVNMLNSRLKMIIIDNWSTFSGSDFIAFCVIESAQNSVT
jgi:hypothetical protein